ncbi:MAG: hypothetical protein JO125_11030, partial [Chloroflexi bacterium]|nr:hypothetical protein [Chloroflexota bacterium]
MTVKDMNITELADACTREMQNYRLGAAHDDQYWLELFHRAIVKGNSEAWQMVQERLTPTVM